MINDLMVIIINSMKNKIGKRYKYHIKVIKSVVVLVGFVYQVEKNHIRSR